MFCIGDLSIWKLEKKLSIWERKKITSFGIKELHTGHNNNINDFLPTTKRIKRDYYFSPKCVITSLKNNQIVKKATCEGPPMPQALCVFVSNVCLVLPHNSGYVTTMVPWNPSPLVLRTNKYKDNAVAFLQQNHQTYHRT